MTALRARREAAGLMQVSLWIRRDDAAAFQAAAQPFRQRAKVAATTVTPPRQTKPPVGATLRFLREVPPGTIRVAMAKLGWRYDRNADQWSITWAEEPLPEELLLLENLRQRYAPEVTILTG